MSSTGPTRGKSDLADMVEMLLDKGVVINADIAVSVGDTELLGVEIRAAIASFETAAQYGLEFPAGTDMERVEDAAAGRSYRGGVSGDDDADEDNDDDADEDENGPHAERPIHPSRRPYAVPESGSDDDED